MQLMEQLVKAKLRQTFAEKNAHRHILSLLRECYRKKFQSRLVWSHLNADRKTYPDMLNGLFQKTI